MQRPREFEELEAYEEDKEVINRRWEDHSMSREERRWTILGALKAALLIGFAYAGGLGLVVLLLLLIWRIL